MQPERRVLLAVAAAGTAWALAGCGFALRQPPRLSFSSIALRGFAPRSPMAQELRAQLARQVRVLEADSPAVDSVDVVLQALEDVRERSAVATTAAAQVRELQLRVRLTLRAYAPGGRVLIPRSELGAARALSYSETAALAKEFEETELYREMQTDLVAQVLRRLATLSL